MKQIYDIIWLQNSKHGIIKNCSFLAQIKCVTSHWQPALVYRWTLHVEYSEILSSRALSGQQNQSLLGPENPN